MRTPAEPSRASSAGLCMPVLLSDFALFSGVVLLTGGIVIAVASLLS
jgi:hypothetical protein